MLMVKVLSSGAGKMPDYSMPSTPLSSLNALISSSSSFA
jgi:hypothetical protein